MRACALKMNDCHENSDDNDNDGGDGDYMYGDDYTLLMISIKWQKFCWCVLYVYVRNKNKTNVCEKKIRYERHFPLKSTLRKYIIFTGRKLYTIHIQSVLAREG